MLFRFQVMLFYHSYSYEHQSPHDAICTMARGMAAWTFAKEHPHIERNRNLHLAKSWKQNFTENWHIHARGSSCAFSMHCSIAPGCSRVSAVDRRWVCNESIF
jgi:hypothetical protein